MPVLFGFQYSVVIAGLAAQVAAVTAATEAVQQKIQPPHDPRPLGRRLDNRKQLFNFMNLPATLTPAEYIRHS